jgi:2-alkyl-3-oxoalkanoate reductase
VSEWIPALAQALAAKPPRRVPAWLARPLAGEYGLLTMMRAQGASNARAKAELGWAPEHASWRQGFRTALG